MPLGEYLHSKLRQDWHKLSIEREAHLKHFHLEAFDISIAFFAAMFVNAAMLIVVAAALQGTGIES